MSETVHFTLEPRGLCDHPERKLIQVKGEPMIFKTICPQCDNCPSNNGINVSVKMSDLKKVLKARLIQLENQAKLGVIPGELDAYELEQLIGRIKELKLVLQLIRANTISEILKGMLNE